MILSLVLIVPTTEKAYFLKENSLNCLHMKPPFGTQASNWEKNNLNLQFNHNPK